MCMGKYRWTHQTSRNRVGRFPSPPPPPVAQAARPSNAMHPLGCHWVGAIGVYGVAIMNQLYQ